MRSACGAGFRGLIQKGVGFYRAAPTGGRVSPWRPSLAFTSTRRTSGGGAFWPIVSTGCSPMIKLLVNLVDGGRNGIPPYDDSPDAEGVRTAARRSQTFKLSSDLLFVDKVRDIIGLYLSPPTRAVVLSVDEKSQIPALDREQSVLPLMPGIPERGSHCDARH